MCTFKIKLVLAVDKKSWFFTVPFQWAICWRVNKEEKSGGLAIGSCDQKIINDGESVENFKVWILKWHLAKNVSWMPNERGVKKDVIECAKAAEKYSCLTTEKQCLDLTAWWTWWALGQRYVITSASPLDDWEKNINIQVSWKLPTSNTWSY